MIRNRESKSVVVETGFASSNFRFSALCGESAVGHSRPGRATSKSRNVRYAAESGSKFRGLAAARSMGEHSTKTKVHSFYLLQSASVSRAELDRTVLQQDQAISACRDPIRQTRGRLPSFRQARIHPNLAA